MEDLTNTITSDNASVDANPIYGACGLDFRVIQNKKYSAIEIIDNSSREIVQL